MRMLAALWLLLALACGAQELKKVTFYCEPEDAQVYMEVAGTRPYLLGWCNRPIPLDMEVLEGRGNLALTFKREGWLDATRTVQSSRYFVDHDRYPDAAQGPVVLNPKTDLRSRFLQLSRHWLLVVSLSVVGLGLAVRLRRRPAPAPAPVAAPLADPLLGTQLSRYRLEEKIGVGGMGSVYRGVRDDGEQVAVKVMHPQFATDPLNRKRFRREIEICRELSHRHVMRLDDFGDQDGVLYLVLELLQGKTLRELLRRRQLSVEEALVYVRPLAEAMDYAHSKDIFHRDLKPENVFVTQDGRVVVMDFGLARGGEYTQHTATHEGLGTPAYMAPEQVQGLPEAASDRYAFGIMLFEMFTGRVPFEGDDPFAVAFAHVGQQPPDLAALRPDLPPHAAATVARLLAKDPRKRFATLAEAVEALAG